MFSFVLLLAAQHKRNTYLFLSNLIAKELKGDNCVQIKIFLVWIPQKYS